MTLIPSETFFDPLVSFLVRQIMVKDFIALKTISRTIFRYSRDKKYFLGELLRRSMRITSFVFAGTVQLAWLNLIID